MPFPHIFEPLTLRHRTLTSRINFGAHTANMAEGGLPGDRHVGYYRERARGGAGMIVVEPVPVHRTAVLTRGNFRHSDDAVIPGFRRLADACRDANPDVVLVQQLYHVGQHGDADNSFAPIYDSNVMKSHATQGDPWSHAWLRQGNAAGFGPYCLTAIDPNTQEYRLSVNRGSYLKPQFTSVIVRAVPSSSTRLLAVRAGAVDGTTDSSGNGFTVKPALHVASGDLELMVGYGIRVDEKAGSWMRTETSVGIGYSFSSGAHLQAYYNQLAEYFVGISVSI